MTRKREFLDYLTDIQDAAQHIYLRVHHWHDLGGVRAGSEDAMQWSEPSRSSVKRRERSRRLYASGMRRFRGNKWRDAG